MYKVVLVSFLIPLMVVACTSGETATPTPIPIQEIPTDIPPSLTETVEDPTATPSPTLTEIPTSTALPTLEPLPPNPQGIKFEADDGTVLQGTYYPAAANPSPVIILMHWARGDQSDWTEIALWLQNRRGETVNGTDASPASISGVLPPLPEELSYAVFTFDFRGFGLSILPSGVSSDPEGWLMDARAAVDTVGGLPGIDPSRRLNIGASIGADGAIDSCAEGCLGVLSLSPGGYLGIPYADAVLNLGDDFPETLVWCLASEGDVPAAES